MNIVFWFLVIVAAFFVWYLVSFGFKEIGEIAKDSWDDLKTNINEEDKNE